MNKSVQYSLHLRYFIKTTSYLYNCFQLKPFTSRIKKNDYFNQNFYYFDVKSENSYIRHNKLILGKEGSCGKQHIKEWLTFKNTQKKRTNYRNSWQK